jgi:beta-mannanase
VPNDPWNSESQAYPGDQYVDWIAFDAYNRGSKYYSKPAWLTFDQMISNPYYRAVRVSANKPVMWAEGAANEYGDGGTRKSDWVNHMFTELSSSSNPYPHLKAITWFESDPSNYRYDSKSTSPVYNKFVYDMRWKNSYGTLYFRSNGNALAHVTQP